MKMSDFVSWILSMTIVLTFSRKKPCGLFKSIICQTNQHFCNKKILNASLHPVLGGFLRRSLYRSLVSVEVYHCCFFVCFLHMILNQHKNNFRLLVYLPTVPLQEYFPCQHFWPLLPLKTVIARRSPVVWILNVILYERITFISIVSIKKYINLFEWPMLGWEESTELWLR